MLIQLLRRNVVITAAAVLKPYVIVFSPPLQLVEKVALPLVAERLSTAYDAMSRRQTACLVSAVSEILVYDPAEESLKTLLGAAREALQVLCFCVV